MKNQIIDYLISVTKKMKRTLFTNSKNDRAKRHYSPYKMDKEFEGLSIRAMTALGVFCLELFSKENQISHPDLQEFKNKMLDLLITDNLPDWEDECFEIKITGVEENALPGDLANKYPKHQNRLHSITESIRSISDINMYGAFMPEESYSCLSKVQKLCEIEIKKEFNLRLFKQHEPTQGWGDSVSKELIEKWKEDAAYVG